VLAADLTNLLARLDEIEDADEPLAQYRVRYQPNKKQLRAVTEPRLFETPFVSPQLSLWELDDAEWLKVIRRDGHGSNRPCRQVCLRR